MTDIFRARRSRRRESQEEEEYSDSDMTLTSASNYEDYTTEEEETSEDESDSDIYEESETDDEEEESSQESVVEQEMSIQKDIKESQQKVPEQSKDTLPTPPPFFADNKAESVQITENMAELTINEPYITSDNIEANVEPVVDHEETQQKIIAEKTVPTMEEESIQQNHQQITTITEQQAMPAQDTNNQKEEVSEMTFHDLEPQHEDFQEKRIQEHREYRRKLAEDPSFVPYVGLFWSHDDRYREDSLTETRSTPVFAAKSSQTNHALHHDRRNDPLMNKKWDHGGYEELLRMEEEDHRRKQDNNQDVEYDTRPYNNNNNNRINTNRPYFNRPRPSPRERQYRNINNSEYKQKEEWPTLGDQSQISTSEKTDVANASWATATIDDLQEHDKPTNRKSNWNSRENAYNNAFRKDSHHSGYKTHNNDRRGRGRTQPSYRERGYKSFDSRHNVDVSSEMHQKSDNASPKWSQKSSESLGRWKDSNADWNSKPDWVKDDVTGIKHIPNGEKREPTEANTGWSTSISSTTDQNNFNWSNVSTEKANHGWNDVPAVENTGWGDLPKRNENTSTHWNDTSKTDNISNGWSNASSTKNSDLGWNNVTDTTSKETPSGWDSELVVDNNKRLDWNENPVTEERNSDRDQYHASKANNDSWKNKDSYTDKSNSRWGSPQNKSTHSRTERTTEQSIENEKASSQWSQPAITINLDLSTAISDGWGDIKPVIHSNKSSEWSTPVIIMDSVTPTITLKTEVAAVESSGISTSDKVNTSDKANSEWSKPLSPPAISAVSTNATEVSDWNVSSPSKTVDTEKISEKDLSPQTTTTKNEEVSEWSQPSIEIGSEKALGSGEIATVENNDDSPEWNKSTATVTSNETPSEQESLGWNSVDTNNISTCKESPVAVKEKEVETPKVNDEVKNSNQEETGRKESAGRWSTLNASANGWTGSEIGRASPSNNNNNGWTANLNWETKNELSGRKGRGYLSQKTEAPIIKAETIELPVDTSINSVLHESYEEDSDVEIILEDDDGDGFKNEQVLGISAPERPANTTNTTTSTIATATTVTTSNTTNTSTTATTTTRYEPWEKKTPSYNIHNTDDYSQQPQTIPMYYTHHMHPNGAIAYVPVLPNGPNSSPIFVPYSMGIPTSPAMGTSSPNNSHSGGASPRKYYSPIPGSSVLQPPPGYEANGMVYYGVDPSAMYAPQPYYYYPSDGYIEQDESDGWGPAPEAPENEEEWSNEPYSQPSTINYPQSYYYYYQQ